MASVWSYEGSRVVVSGGGGGGMGAATVRELKELGAEIHVLDLREPPVEVASYQAADLRDPAAIATAVDNIGGRIDALFNCAGLPGGRFPDLDVMLVNFVGMRHLAELVVPHMEPGGAIASISSTAGRGWEQNVESWLPLVQTAGFEAGRAWCEAHPAEIAGGYGPSKQAMIIWTMYAAVDLANKGIRINCISPGPTDTPMMPDFPQAIIERYPIPLGRHSRPEEQAFPLIFLNSRAASYITGENLITDGGTMGGVSTGRIDLVKVLSAVMSAPGGGD
jgi:NAD(P)-dependent dehydrogenase (short-subunit alcohol dehydrogenase family)